MSDFEQELKTGFLDEATQLLAEAEQCFLALEDEPGNIATIEKIFRIAHNIKGSSRAVGFDNLGAFTHEFESFLLKCKSGEISITPVTVSLLLACNDHVQQFVEKLKSDSSAELDGSELVRRIQFFKPEAQGALEPRSETSAEASAELLVDPDEATPEESFSRDDVLLLKRVQDGPGVPAQTEVLPPPPMAPNPQVQAKGQTTPVAGGDESIRVSLSRLERLLNFVGEMVILQTVLQEQSVSDNPILFRRTIHQIGKVTKEVQDLSMSLRMIPLKQTFQKMQRIVRDTSSVLNKKVNLVLEGEETEVDKTVLESLSDPLVHLIRNAVDHGIEAPGDRVAKGKNEVGTVVLKAYHQSGKLVIEITDDGGGIPAARLREKAIERGILKPAQVITDQQAIELIFHPGFSTKAEVTEVSGRGVGMDVVKTNIEQMQGEVLVETTLGKGSTFKIVLPLTLAIIDGMVVRCAGGRFVIPRSHVHESIKLQEKDIKFITSGGEVLYLRGENLPLVRLASYLGKVVSEPRIKETHIKEQIAIIVRSQGKPFAALVDDIVGQQQVVIKKLGDELKNVRGFSGSAILGDGRPALILELADLLSVATNRKQAS